MKIQSQCSIIVSFILTFSCAALAENSDILQQIPSADGAPRIYTSDEKKAALDKTTKAHASQYAYISKPSSFWHFSYSKRDFDTVDNSRYKQSLLEHYFNGNFRGTSHGPLVTHYFKNLVEGYSEKCGSYLGSAASIISIVTTQTTSNRISSTTKKVGERNVYVLKKYAKTYKEVYYRNKKIGVAPDTMVRMLLTPSAVLQEFAGTLSLAAKGYSHTYYLLKQEACDSKVVAQLFENLYRAIRGLPSIQNDSKRTAIDSGVRKSPRFLYYDYQKFRSSVIEFFFSGSFRGHISPSPRDLLKATINKFGERDYDLDRDRVRDRSSPWQPKLTMENAADGELKSMLVGYMMGGSATLMGFRHLADGFLDWDPALKYDKELKSKVDSHYVGLVGKQKYRVVECTYQGGGYLVYWLDERPKGASRAELRAVYEYHPLLVVQDSRDRCPAELRQGNLGKDYIYGARGKPSPDVMSKYPTNKKEVREKHLAANSIVQCDSYFLYYDVGFMKKTPGCITKRYAVPYGYTVTSVPPDADVAVVEDLQTWCLGIMSSSKHSSGGRLVFRELLRPVHILHKEEELGRIKINGRQVICKDYTWKTETVMPTDGNLTQSERWQRFDITGKWKGWYGRSVIHNLVNLSIVQQDNSYTGQMDFIVSKMGHADQRHVMSYSGKINARRDVLEFQPKRWIHKPSNKKRIYEVQYMPSFELKISADGAALVGLFKPAKDHLGGALQLIRNDVPDRPLFTTFKQVNWQAQEEQQAAQEQKQSQKPRQKNERKRGKGRIAASSSTMSSQAPPQSSSPPPKATPLDNSQFSDTSTYGKIISYKATVKVSSSSQYDRGKDPRLLVSPEPVDNFAFHTRNEKNPWVEIDLGKEFDVTAVRIHNREKYKKRAASLRMLVSSNGKQWREVWKAPNIMTIWEIPISDTRARYIRLQNGSSRRTWLHLKQVQIYGKEL